MPNSRVADAIDNAELLVDFASRNAFSINPDLIQGVTKARSLFDQGKLVDTEEAAFFQLYNNLAQAFQTLGKVTVSSIRDSREEFGELARKYWFGPKIKMSKAYLAVRQFRCQGIIALILLLGIQIYWLSGSTLIDGQREIEKEQKQAKESKAVAQAQQPSTPESKAHIDSLNTDLGNLMIRFSTLHSLLERWYDFRKWFSPAQYSSLDDPSKWEETAKKQISLRVAAENRLRALQIYFLPLLYGWVGACAYVLRQLIAENRDRTYRSESNIAYNLRILLGILAGLAVGWFLRPSADDKLVGQLAPFTISFLAGYSVEVLFSAMDKIVGAFGSFSQSSKS